MVRSGSLSAPLDHCQTPGCSRRRDSRTSPHPVGEDRAPHDPAQRLSAPVRGQVTAETAQHVPPLAAASTGGPRDHRRARLDVVDGLVGRPGNARTPSSLTLPYRHTPFLRGSVSASPGVILGCHLTVMVVSPEWRLQHCPRPTTRRSTLRYFGSKASSAHRILDIVRSEHPTGSLCDPFGGVGTVGSLFKRHGYAVTTGDQLLHAHYFQIARVQRDRTPSFRRLRRALGLRTASSVVEELNRKISPASSWLVRRYAIERRFFTLHNARRIAGCHTTIHGWLRDGLLTHQERAVLLASLVNSMDRVANTAGTYYAYLKKWYRKSRRPFRFDLIRPTTGPSRCQSLLAEAQDVVSGRHFDVLYLDPPHNDRRYSGYYHLPETVCRGGCPAVHGLAGIPDTPGVRSDYNSRRRAGRALSSLLGVSTFRLLILHYSDDGLIPPAEVRRLLSGLGHLTECVVSAPGYTSTSRLRRVEQRLYCVRHA